MDNRETTTLVNDVQKAYKVKSKLKKLLQQLDQSKQGFVNSEAFFQMLELHGISLRAEDKMKLKQICVQGTNQMKFKDALQLVNVNREINRDGSPVRYDMNFWVLSLPRRYQTKKSNAEFETMSQISKYTANSLQSLDTVVRKKAEQVFNNSFDDIMPQLDVIHENEEYNKTTKPKDKLSKARLAQLDKSRSNTIDASVRTNSIMSAIKAENYSFLQPKGSKDIFENKSIAKSAFKESSVDQDDSYGNYKPAFMTKKRAVNGRSPQIMQLQRQASLDQEKAILKQFHDVIPEPRLGKKIISETTEQKRDQYDIVAPIKEYEDSPSSPRFYRKAEENFPHDQYTNSRDKFANLSSNKKVQTSIYKNKINQEFLTKLGEIDLPEKSKKLVACMINSNQEYRSLLKFKNNLFEREHSDRIEYDTYKEVLMLNKSTFASEKIELMFLDAVMEGGYISKKLFSDVLDTYLYLPVRAQKDMNKSENMYYVLTSNQRGNHKEKEELHNSISHDPAKSQLHRFMTLIGIKIHEKFRQFNKAFRFFDCNGDLQVNRSEFHEAVEKLKVKLQKEDVDKVFDYLDQDQDGTISYQEFTQFSEEKLVKLDPFDSFNFQQILALDRENSERMSLFKAVNTVGSRFEEQFSSFKEAFAFIDIDRDGHINREEFRSAVHKLNINGIGRVEADMVFSFLDKNGNNVLEFSEFQILHSSSRKKLIVHRQVQNQAKIQEKMNLTKAMTLIAYKFEERYHSIQSAFKAFDSDQDGQITLSEFTTGLMSMRINMSKADIEMVFRYLDKDKDDTISFQEFKELQFKPKIDTHNVPLAKLLIYFAQKLEEKFPSVQAAFKFFDSNQNHLVSRDEFLRAVERLKLSMSNKDADQIFKHLDTDNDGSISVKELQDFQSGHIIKDRMHMSKLLLSLASNFDLHFRDIKEAFQEFDKNNDRLITKEEFKTNVRQLKSGMDNDEIDLIFDFMDGDKNGVISFDEFCLLNEERFKHNQPAVGLGDKKQRIKVNMGYIANQLLKEFPNLKKAFEYIDMDDDKNITKTEMLQAITKLGIRISSSEINEVFEMLDSNNDGTISLQEFMNLETQTILNSRSPNKSSSDLKQLKRAIKVIQNKIQDRFFNLQSAFSFMDSDKDGTITKQEFSACCDKIQVPLNPKIIDSVFDFMDLDENGEIDFNEFKIFHANSYQNVDEDSQEEELNINNVIRLYKGQNDKMHLNKIIMFVQAKLKTKVGDVEKAFKTLDHDGDRQITKAEFAQGLNKHNICLPKADVSMIFDHLDTDKDETISFNEFKLLYKVHDIEEGTASNTGVTQFHVRKLLMSLRNAMVNRYGSVEAGFRIFDQNNNQEISRSEFSQQIHKFGINPKEADKDLMFDFLDKNKDEKIELAEFKNIKHNLQSSQESQPVSQSLSDLVNKASQIFPSLEKAFEYMDFNHDGRVQFAEFNVGLRQLGLKLTTKEAQNLFNTLDRDQDGGVTLNEFKEATSQAMQYNDIMPRSESMQILSNPYQLPLDQQILANQRRQENILRHAEEMMQFNSQAICKKNRGYVPKHLMTNSSFAFGVSSGIDMSNENGKFQKGSSSMAHIISHSDNIKNDVIKRITQNYSTDSVRDHSFEKALTGGRRTIQGTNASDLRSKSTAAKHALMNFNTLIERARINKGRGVGTSFIDIERHRHKVDRLTMLPPIEQIRLFQTENSDDEVQVQNGPPMGLSPRQMKTAHEGFGSLIDQMHMKKAKEQLLKQYYNSKKQLKK